jgi:hypothetical protein
MIVHAPRDAPRLSRFAIARPAYVTPQLATLEWLARAHAASGSDLAFVSGSLMVREVPR